MRQIGWLLAILMLGLLAGCGNSSAQTIYNHLETSVSAERSFEKQQEQLQRAEEKEHELFEEMITLGLREMDEISIMADEALLSINNRLEMVGEEKESIEKSYAEFQRIEEEKDKIKDKEQIDKLNELTEAMIRRYEHYQQLHTYYKEAANHDKVLFEMLKREDLTLDELQEQIDIVNELYRHVDSEKDQFNTFTEQYNQMKREFYELAGLPVE